MNIDALIAAYETACRLNGDASASAKLLERLIREAVS